MSLKCELKSVRKAFGAFVAVDDVSLRIEDGEFVVILGPSGCGKTTTMRLIAGLENPTDGSIAIDNRIVSDPGRGVFVRPERRDIGMVFQSYAIWPHMTVFENVAYPLRVRRVRGADLSRRVQQALEVVGLEKELKRSATALSGGQMQRVALARALVANPTLLLFDEPLSNLDLKLREHLRIELKELQRRTGLTSIYVTHDQAEAVELADRIVVMDAGRVVQVGRPAELYARPNAKFVAEFISSANIFEAIVVSQQMPQGDTELKTEGGRAFSAHSDEILHEGDRVEVMIHPEDCILDESDGSRDWLHVELLQTRYQGTSTRYTVRWGNAPFDVIVQGTTSELTEGAEKRLRVRPGSARVIPQEGRRP
ncbi:ABC transporter ATP-binding protein [Bradyrhizobium sp. LTSP885]|uniref:ABC transporter ATP-binding protein n=1 Tax=Bradyrhizobium sp. LTSP885 TaxID=1619232 RepID=UPI0005C815C9|nr:ABC transporter ATP-binding protein [Bradyrhizobium sp. LTSP885]